MRARASWVLSLCLIVAACDLVDTDLERDALDVPMEEIIRLERTGQGALPANGTSTEVLRAIVPRDSKTRTVTFETNLGGFEEAGGGKKLDVIAWKHPTDPKSLVAAVTFRADTLGGAVLIRATILGFQASVALTLTR